MSVWSWIKLTVCQWLLRRAVRITGWMLAVVLAVAAWPLTLVAAAGYVTAWLQGWPPIRLFRAAAWSLPAAVVWLAGLALRGSAWQAATVAPGQAWTRGWRYLAIPGLARTSVLVAPAAVPAGLAVAGAGQACYIHHGAATFVQVARPRPSPLTLLPSAAPGPSPVQVPAPRREAEPGPQPNPVPASLDDVFGPGGTP